MCFQPFLTSLRLVDRGREIIRLIQALVRRFPVDVKRHRFLQNHSTSPYHPNLHHCTLPSAANYTRESRHSHVFLCLSLSVHVISICATRDSAASFPASDLNDFRSLHVPSTTMASTPGDGKVAPSDTPEALANAPVEKAPDESSKLRTLLGLLRRYGF